MRPECKGCYYFKRIYKKEKGCAYFLNEGKTRTFIDGECACKLILTQQETKQKYREYRQRLFVGR